jgi:hypothetical protein
MPPPRISLRQPKNDTTGYIIDKIMMPRSLPHFPPGHKQTVAIYYVGYRDRPIERGLVPYNEILQHVSLRELEEWYVEPFTPDLIMATLGERRWRQPRLVFELFSKPERVFTGS